jgi:hypothetical protein
MAQVVLLVEVQMVLSIVPLLLMCLQLLLA